MIYRTPEEKASRLAFRNVFILLTFAGAMIWAGVELSEAREARLAAADSSVTLSGSMAYEVTRQLCIEINDDDYLVVCPE